MYILLVAIDVSKDFSSVAGINSGGNEIFSKFYSMDSNGFEELLKTIISHCEDPSKVIVAMEATDRPERDLTRNHQLDKTQPRNNPKHERLKDLTKKLKFRYL